VASDLAFNERIERIVMLKERRHDEAAVLLFDLHKLHIDEWTAIKDRLYRLYRSPSRLSELTTIIYCSSSYSLSGWEHLIPGLSQFSAHHEPTELFD
jgi:hypothetical protein